MDYDCPLLILDEIVLLDQRANPLFERIILTVATATPTGILTGLILAGGGQGHSEIDFFPPYSLTLR